MRLPRLQAVNYAKYGAPAAEGEHSTPGERDLAGAGMGSDGIRGYRAATVVVRSAEMNAGCSFSAKGLHTVGRRRRMDGLGTRRNRARGQRRRTGSVGVRGGYSKRVLGVVGQSRDFHKSPGPQL